MTLIRKFALVLAATVSIASVGVTANNAYAGGVIGDIIEGACGGCGAGKALDQLNGAAGRPFEKQVVRPLMNSYVPGSGDAFIMGQRIQDGLNRGPGPAVQPTPYPQPNGGGYPTAYQPMPQPQMGGACYTPVGVVRGPQFNGPVGTPCWFPTMYGPAQGQVGF